MRMQSRRRHYYFSTQIKFAILCFRVAKGRKERCGEGIKAGLVKTSVRCGPDLTQACAALGECPFVSHYFINQNALHSLFVSMKWLWQCVLFLNVNEIITV